MIRKRLISERTSAWWLARVALVMVLSGLAALPLAAQTVDGAPSTPSRKVRRMEARQQVQLLKNGILLVRLHTSTPQIKALKQRGDAATIKEIMAANQALNQDLVQGFAYFNFCPVRYFYDTSIKAIAAGHYTNRVLNQQLYADNLTRYDTTTLLVASYSTNVGAGVTGIEVCSLDLDRLPSPFPGFVQQSTLRGRKKLPAELDEKIRRYAQNP
jgi:hypothetical protein